MFLVLCVHVGTLILSSAFQRYTSKGAGRQGIVLKHRTSLQKEPMPHRPTSLLVLSLVLCSASNVIIIIIIINY